MILEIFGKYPVASTRILGIKSKKGPTEFCLELQLSYLVNTYSETSIRIWWSRSLIYNNGRQKWRPEKYGGIVENRAVYNPGFYIPE